MTPLIRFVKLTLFSLLVAAAIFIGAGPSAAQIQGKCVMFCDEPASGTSAPRPETQAEHAANLANTAASEYSRGNYRNAMALYEEAQRNAPGSAHIGRKLALAQNKVAKELYEKGDLHGAIDLLKKASANNPSEPVYRDNLRNLENELASASSGGSRTGGTATAGGVCDVCGRALLSDVAYGLKSSSIFQAYLEHSLDKWTNCARKDADTCFLSCGHSAHRSMSTCTRWQDEAAKACVRTALRGVEAECGN